MSLTSKQQSSQIPALGGKGPSAENQFSSTHGGVSRTANFQAAVSG